MYRQGNAWAPLQQQPQQLPQGWEAKWDPNSRRWFYIDHRTKTTHWEPPAWQQPAAQPQRMTTSFMTEDNGKVKSLMSEYEGVSEEYIKSLLRVYQNNMNAVRKNLNQRGYRKKFSVEPKSNLVSSLKWQYPSASEDVIKDVLVNTSNNIAGARLSLEAMGYQKKNTEEKKTGGINIDDVHAIIAEYDGVSKEYAESLLRIYGSNVTNVKKNLDEKGYKKKKNSVVPNQGMASSLNKRYPAAGTDIINQVLMNTSNNFGRSCTSLEAMGYKKSTDEKVANKAAKKPAATKKATATTSDELDDATKKSRLNQLKKKFPTVAESVVKLSLEGTMYDVKMAEAILKSSVDAVNSRSASSVPSTSTTSTSPTESSEVMSTSFTPVVFGDEDIGSSYEPEIPSTLTSSIVPPQSSYTKPEESYKKREYVPPPRKVYSRKILPQSSYVSANRCQAVGPDPSLVHGPNRDLLQAHLFKAAGPNPANRAGPLKSNRCGPLPSNAKGRAGIDVGPMRGRLLTTNI